MHEAGHPRPVLWDDPEGGMGRKVGGGSGWGTRVRLWPLMLMYSDNHNTVITLHLKQKQ